MPLHSPVSPDLLRVAFIVRSATNADAVARWTAAHPDWFAAGVLEHGTGGKAEHGPASGRAVPLMSEAAETRGPAPRDAGQRAGLPAFLSVSSAPARMGTPRRVAGQVPGESEKGDRRLDFFLRFLRPGRSNTLPRSLERNGTVKPGEDAHHIVPQGGGSMTGNRNARPAQEALRRLGMSLDDVENGAGLSPEFHRR